MAIVLGGVVLVVGAGIFVALRNPRRSMFLGPSTTRVPVDDFVVGDLPMVCVRTGRDAHGLVETRSSEGMFQLWWLLLLFLGPVGVVAIVLLWTLSARPARISGSLPMTREALDHGNHMATLGMWAWAVPLVALLAGAAVLLAVPRVDGLPVEPFGVGVLLIGLVGGFVAIAVVGHLSGRETVGVQLDGTGRWVELANVHPSFATAVNRQTRARHTAARERRERLDS